ncbi:succinyl-CoA synthetase beta subunit, partial [Nocardiopsis flavescens]
MDLHEYEAKRIFGEYGVALVRGEIADTPGRAAEAAGRLGGKVVVKAQVKTGGRGKAGGVKVAEGPEGARAEAERILGMDIKGHTVHRVLVEEASDIAEEYYFSFL